jgi:hypothetical protein
VHRFCTLNGGLPGPAASDDAFASKAKQLVVVLLLLEVALNGSYAIFEGRMKETGNCVGVSHRLLS